METGVKTKAETYRKGIPETCWDAIGQPAQALMLGSGLGPAASGFIKAISEFSRFLTCQHQNLKAAYLIAGGQMFDHIIIGDDSYVSLQREGRLK